MTPSFSRIIVLLIVLSSSVEGLRFSFRSQYDGYIYPSWKKKGKNDEYLIDDAVVVGKEFMVLAGGVKETAGFSGLFSQSLCLKIAEELKTFVPEKLYDVSSRVNNAIGESKFELGFNSLCGSMRDAASTLVFLKLNYKQLFAGVVGNSGFSVFRYNKKRKIIELVKRSKEDMKGLFTPYKITADNTEKQLYYEYNVNVGDIVMAYSDGVSDVVPPSFLIAVINILVANTIEKQKQKKPIYDLEYDYDYDLAGFVEGYVQRLIELDLKLDNYLVEELRGKEKNDHNIYYKNKNENNQVNLDNRDFEQKKLQQFQNQENQAEKQSYLDIYQFLLKGQNKFFQQDEVPMKQQPDYHKKVQKISYQELQWRNQHKVDLDDEEPQFQASFEEFENKIKQADRKERIRISMDEIFKSENCNLFDPTRNSSVFKLLDGFKEFSNLISTPSQQDDQNTIQSYDCFRNKKIEKKINRYSEPKKWTCKNILDLTYPIFPTQENYSSLSDCVLEAIPKLPDNITPEEIAKAFNSRYVARNIALAVKYILNDPRIANKYFILKRFLDIKANNEPFNDARLSEIQDKWTAKQVDVSIAAAAIGNNIIFNQPKPNKDKSNVFKRSFRLHSSSVAFVFKDLNDKEKKKIII